MSTNGDGCDKKCLLYCDAYIYDYKNIYYRFIYSKYKIV